ncbi:MAG TPA: hypothetical protein VFK14_00210 [Solirubrobacterales bacterium]|nr:hypothetical protein [Solirubrobacterales bacterium]
MPFRGGCPHRARAWEWVQASYAEAHPDWQLVEAPAPPGPWCKGAAVNPVIAASDAEIIVQADADVWADGLSAAVDAIVGGAPWVVPFAEVHRLNEDATKAVLSGADWRRQEDDLDQHPYPGVLGGGALVARRETLLTAPLDLRFRGWGQEDLAQGAALRELAGPPWRAPFPLLHLWHPPQERISRKHGSEESWALWGRYKAAQGRPEAMRALLEEGRCRPS